MKIHFIGIGGIGVSALAQYHLLSGDTVSGSDPSNSDLIQKMKEMGAIIFNSNSKDNIEDYDLVVYSPAVKDTNPELTCAREKGIKTLSYPQALGELSKKHFTIAISGTHGKSTTTAMTSLILIEAGLDPTVIIGTKLKEFGNSNFRMGNSKYLVIEACEHEASFLNYHPEIGVILNIEADHLDYYKNIENIKEAFNKFASQSKIVIDSAPIIGGLKVGVPGEHNIRNASFAIAVARQLNIEDDISFRAVAKFSGTWRRFDEHIINNIIIIDDYAHHPTEILTTLKGIREKYSDKKIYCFFQPHQYQRTSLLLEEFIKSFKEVVKIVDSFFIIDIYDVLGREDNSIKISSEEISKMVDGLEYVRKEGVAEKIKNGEVIVFMGAGDIYNLSCDIKKTII
ncbi:MAG: Mur ligase domain-containing protein [Candidatus Pacebacteria bacterium]|nr:Mur ligase domain-containing protein [Candidatus Paceibacterota bacterium]